jgi:1,4-dihydroxy-2-naphthoyl-CoA hydrolase
LSIWKKEFSLDLLNSMCVDTAAQSLGIKITNFGDNFIEGSMPVDKRTCQPRGLLHGGASVLFAETLGSIGGFFAAKKGFAIVGIEVNANHIAGIEKGYVVGIAKAVHIGRTTQVWDIKINEKGSNKAICVSRLTLAVIAV